jgi:hypothetical protein
MRWTVPVMTIKEVNGIDITKYRSHPRVLELRLAMLFKMLSEEYDPETANRHLHNLCEIFRCNWNVINQIVNNVYTIRKISRDNRVRWRQELVFMGMTTNESRYRIAYRYLNLTVTSTYRKEYRLSPTVFIDQEWLDKLDENVVICGLNAYRYEAERFLFEFDNYLEVLGRVLIPKTGKENSKPIGTDQPKELKV